jgi:hypothetical protein
MHRHALGAPAARGGGFGRGAIAPLVVDACTRGAAAPAPTPAGRGGRGGAAILPTGQYTVRLTVDGQTYTQPVTIKPDPRGLPAGVE